MKTQTIVQMFSAVAVICLSSCTREVQKISSQESPTSAPPSTPTVTPTAPLTPTPIAIVPDNSAVETALIASWKGRIGIPPKKIGEWYDGFDGPERVTISKVDYGTKTNGGDLGLSETIEVYPIRIRFIHEIKSKLAGTASTESQVVVVHLWKNEFGDWMSKAEPIVSE
jgi:hypothetical protein